MSEIKQEETKRTGNNNTKKKGLLVLAVVIIIGIVSVYFYMGYKSTHISTDDAFIDGDIHTVASKVPGTVQAVLVKDNQYVKKGDVLAILDPADFDVKVNEASSALAAEKSREVEAAARINAAKKQLAEMQFRVEAAKASLALQEANLKQAEIDYMRAGNLYKKEAISRDRFEKAGTGRDVAKAQVKVAKDQLNQAEAATEVQKTAIVQAETAAKSQASQILKVGAVLKSAELSHSYTKIVAPADGYVTKKSVEVGNQIQAGQPLMAVVPLDDIHVVANYKETQLEKVKVGQKVEIKVDSYPGRKFQGKVESMMSGTGAAFSLFPPENATGNFVKIVQRIPVKIVFDKDAVKEHVLRVGMSVEPTILAGSSEK